MFMRSIGTVIIAVIAVVTCATLASGADKPAPHLGTPLTEQELAAWNLTVYPDGRGLPAGKGTPAQGRALFVTHCEGCHGPEGRGATAEELVGEPVVPGPGNPAKAIGPYWPFATTIFDFVRRSKPPEAPGRLSADDVYALTAYLLAANKIIAETEVMSAETLAKVKMPNSNGFLRIDAP